jgi:undecaprenyl-diphosphatase
MLNDILLTMDISAAIIFGLVHGVTQFLPISSTGHLVLLREVILISDLYALALTAVLYVATALAAATYLWRDIWLLVQVLLRKLGRLPVNERDLVLCQAVCAGTVPGIIVGFGLWETLSQFETAPIVATVLCISAIFFMYAEWRYFTTPQRGAFTPRTGFLIGLFQALSVIPGLSRMGITVAGGMLLGLTRSEAVRFSLLLAIPITAGVGIRRLLELISTDGTVAWTNIIAAGLVSYAVSLVVIHLFLRYISRHTLWPFIWYSIILSCLIGYVSLFV